MPRSDSNYDWGSDPKPPWWRRIFAGGDNPLMWSVPIGAVGGITVRVSIVYIIWMLIELLRSGSLVFKAWYIASLFVLVLLHEFGHCIACRRVGGEADNILMWMLGGLAYCRPPHTWWANFVTTAGGPLVNLLLIPVFAGVMVALGAPLDSMVFNPFGDGVGEAWRSAVGGMGHAPSWIKTPLFTLYLTNLALLLFNVLLPMFPMDGGRLLQAVLWRRLGFSRSMWIATRIGLFAAVVVGLYAVFQNSPTLIGLAIMCGLTCFSQQQMLKVMAASGESEREPWAADADAWKRGGQGERANKTDAKRRERAAKAAEEERRQAVNDSAELDRILAKIKDKGMASLSRSEQAFLRSSTQRSRGQ